MHHVIDLPPSEVAGFEEARRKRQVDRFLELLRITPLAAKNWLCLAAPKENMPESRAYRNACNKYVALSDERHALRRKLYGPWLEIYTGRV